MLSLKQLERDYDPSLAFASQVISAYFIENHWPCDMCVNGHGLQIEKTGVTRVLRPLVMEQLPGRLPDNFSLIDTGDHWYLEHHQEPANA